ncbi:MAG: heavy-metal-associated domain-containing protein [Thermoleophilaceae bacterium]
METLVLQVTGMSCSGCEQRIATVLSRLDGVVRSSADHTTGDVRVVLDTARNSEEAVSDAIRQAGYQVIGHE